ncbi:MAG: TnpV protein, partial [Clostridia bacterium]|nr:TnpV protein [Clostridia bacterium]
MEKSIFEQMGGTYREEDSCLIPNLSLPEREEHTIGKYGQLHLDFLKKHRRGM